jgi:HSP20 family protein
MTEEDVDVTIMRDALSIKGEKKVEVEEKETNYYRMERSYGSFTRTIPLPESVVDQENVSAEFRNGVLTITLPKLAEAQSVTRKIPVNTQE